ncbi:hypothetical protein SAMN05421824_0266 [Hyunsoonleella jejuensis]|uniref:Por secretion system C-terminal sorting domain-containing protein n=1 Tax=Hyunsoonleella jejuensis TaxID=419940 RepID=A0A1H9AJL0_9FLAO|nr:hypothetical protein [Hyunsoonleella jejuensis]SEP76954.1 hypothetical protein SAMN05421824_0266 [Hyunsoonleella jejuensis]
MKNAMNNSKKVLLMVALLATVIGYANDNTFFIRKGEANKTLLSIDVKEGNLFTIKDENGIILYKDFIEQTGIYTQGFDLTALPDGDYFFELDKDMEITIMPFTVYSNKVTFEKENSKTIFKPSTRVKDDMVFVNRLSMNQAPVEIRIYFNSGGAFTSYELIHSEILTSEGNYIRKVYKIKDFTKGDYKIVYKTEGKTFVEFI